MTESDEIMPHSKYEKSPGVIRGVLIEHLRLLIRLRWLACIGIVAMSAKKTPRQNVLDITREFKD